MSSQREIKSGDKVRMLVDYLNLRAGQVYTVTTGTDRGEPDFVGIMYSGHYSAPHIDIVELVEDREFKVGDWVTCIKSSGGGSFIRGHNYQVAEVNPGHIRVISDSEGDDNGWVSENFIKAAYQGTPPDYEGIIQSMQNMIAETEEIYRKLVECQKILDS